MSGPFLRTALGHNVYLGRPTRIYIEDAANQLAKINRFLGATREPYSVAQHSVWVAQKIREAGHSRTCQIAGLLHDVPEFILGDLSRPVQEFIFGKPDRNLAISTPWVDAHEELMDELLISLNLPRHWSPSVESVVEHFDNMALRTEWRDLMPGPEPENFAALPPCHIEKIEPLISWRDAEALFLQEYNFIRVGMELEQLK